MATPPILTEVSFVWVILMKDDMKSGNQSLAMFESPAFFGNTLFHCRLLLWNRGQNSLELFGKRKYFSRTHLSLLR